MHKKTMPRVAPKHPDTSTGWHSFPLEAQEVVFVSLPKRKYYSLKKAAYHLKCEVDDLLHYASIGMLQLCVYIRADSREWSTSVLVISKWTEELTQDVVLEHCDKLLYVTELNSVSENVSGYLVSPPV